MEELPNENVVPIRRTKRSLADLAIQGIDNGMEAAASVTIEQGLQRAIERGEMTIKQAEECLEAYNRTFHGGDDAA